MTRAVAPGRVNIIGDHTDYTGGLVFPMAIDRWTTIDFVTRGSMVELSSDDDPDPVRFDPSAPFDPTMTPRWGRYVAAVASLVDSPVPLQGRVSTTIPVGAGLSSSAALEIAAALAMGCTLPAPQLAAMAQRAEHLATGVPTGIMDQLSIVSAREGHGTLIDCRTLEVTHIAIPDDVRFIVRFIAHRTLEGSEYADRVAQCRAAESVIGPLRDATMRDLAHIDDLLVRRRARHVVSENGRVSTFIEALTSRDLVEAGRIMTEGHRSLSDDFATSTPTMDSAVAELLSTPGVLGARMTGGGFGGCVVALCEPDADVQGWHVSPVGAARLESD